MARFNMEKYNKIKQLLEDNKITSKDLAAYTVLKNLRYLRHQRKIEATDEELIDVVNYERERESLTHGENYVEGDLLLPWQKRSSNE